MNKTADIQTVDVLSPPMPVEPEPTAKAAVAADKPAAAARPARAAGRLVSLDVYRGFIMLALMSHGFVMALFAAAGLPKDNWLVDQFEHRAWEGCTFWDLIQPSFMFMVGVAMPFAFARRQERGDSWGRQFAHALRRALLLVAIGIVLDSWGQPVPTVQFIRGLQQIAIGYVIAFLVLHKGPWLQALAAALILIGHTAAYLWYGGGPETAWIRDHNLGTFVDQGIHAPFAAYPNILPVSTGGYALINAISATATILFGVICGEWLRSDWTAQKKMLALAAAAAGGLVLGLALSPWVPLVKRLWTASFALYAGGWTFLIMLTFYVVVDVLQFRRWTFPVVVVGVNSILAYVMPYPLRGPIQAGLRPFVTAPLSHLGAWGPAVLAGLVVLCLWLILYWCYRRQIFLKV